ncbi:ATP-binding cassette domain-containing protein [Ochrobactrum haematophilum]|uniref:ATP-binding cassette domain-containing protein n=1 Tax=Brucella haematophila TaxID=419474 RepID=A0ABX1DPE4_9HYPH|nr:ATP-binding cassette domain-containing protein [Brucella haematophila]
MPHSPITALPVTIRSLSKHYGSVRAVDDVSFNIQAGEFLTLLGPSGSGKTSLLMMIAGFSRPTAGSIRIADQEIIHLPPHKRNIGMVFQNYALFPHMSVQENVAYPLRLRKVSKSDVETRVNRVLDMVQLSGYGARRINELSGGQRQRIALARAIIFEPRILLMDEPLSALDKQLRETMQIEIRKLHDRLGMTTISVTHDQREALTMSDRIAVFCNGKLAQIATPSDLYEKPDSRFVAEFIGETSFCLCTKRLMASATTTSLCALPETCLRLAVTLCCRCARNICALSLTKIVLGRTVIIFSKVWSHPRFIRANVFSLKSCWTVVTRFSRVSRTGQIIMVLCLVLVNV